MAEAGVVGVVGAGLIGRAWGMIFARAGWSVRLWDPVGGVADGAVGLCAAGLRDTRAIPVEEVVAALPRELVAGGDQGRLGVMLERYRESLYPEDVRIDVDAARRVEQANRVAGLLKADVDLGTLLDRAVLDG